MQTIEEYLPEHPFFAGLDEPTLELLAGCATHVPFKAHELLFPDGAPAPPPHVARQGRHASPGPPPSGA